MLVRRSCMPLRRMRSIAGLILFACAAIVLNAPVRAQNPCPTPATCGAWEGPWDWTAQVPYAPPPNPPPPTQPCAAPEFSHAALISTGPYQGKVLLWRFGSYWNVPGQPAGCHYDYRTSFWIFDPALQGANPKLARLGVDIPYDIFCSGLSWDRNGELVVAGGTRDINGGHTPSRAFKFRATALGPYVWDAAGNPIVPVSLWDPAWIELVSMRLPRFYPIVFHLLLGLPYYGTGLVGSCTALDTSSTMVIGGPEQGAIPPSDPTAQPTANRLWELLGPDAMTTTPWSCPFRPPGSHLPPPYDAYALGSPAPETDLDT